MRDVLAAGLLVLLGCADRRIEPAAAPAPDLSPAPIAAGATLALGVIHSCALEAGQVYCWGYGGHGQLGVGDRNDRTAPTLVPDLTDVVAITAGTWHTCALRRGGEVLCWGDGVLGQLGDGHLGTRPLPGPIPGLRAVAIAAGGTHTCAIDQARKVLCWGSNYRGESAEGGTEPRLHPTALAGSPAADALALGDAFSCALAAGTVSCWGADPLRDGHDTSLTVVPGLDHIIALAAGDDHLCAVTGAGTILCIGTGSEGQLGDGRPPDLEPARGPHGIASPRPRSATVAGIDDAVQLALGSEFACARRRSGALSCWGDGDDGQLGDGARTGRDLPAPIRDLAGVIEIAAGVSHACARLAGGELRCWGYNEFAQVAPLAGPASTPTTHRLAATRLSVGSAHACAWTDADAWCWGDGTYGQLGDGARDRRETPTPVRGLGRIRELVAGARHTCALEHGGTVMCWGDDTYGQLAGRGRPTGEPVEHHRGPLPLPPIDTRSRPRAGPVAGLADVIDIDVYDHYTCALRRGGQITCWHAWEDDPLTSERLVPGAVEIAQGAAHTCARLADGGVRCWGTNHTGRLGDGTTVEHDGPVAVRGLDDAIALVAGRLHTCALRREGQVVCWGDGFMGQLGDGSRAERHAPTPVPDLGPARAIAAAEDTTCAIGQDQRLLCWGDDSGGQLGPAGAGGRFTPVLVAASPTRGLAVGARAVCSASDAGTLACWGDGLVVPAPHRWDVVTTPRAIALAQSK